VASEDPNELIRTAVHKHFADRAKITGLAFNRLLKQGRNSLLIGLLFLAMSTPQQDVVGSCGGHLGCRRAGEPYDCRTGRHVAPMQIYLYEWWPLLPLSRFYTRS
jgi:hypothetical protein